MKRAAALVSYSSSDEDDESEHPSLSAAKPQLKKRKLPPLAETIATPPPIDNPALHQGRVRATPHIEGQWAAHIYVSVTLGESSSLHKLVQNVFNDCKDMVPTLQEISKTEGHRRQLHVSLSRPIFLRTHQREELKLALRNIARQHAPFRISFAAFAELVNDEKTRTFLAMEIGAGHHDLRKLSDALSPTLESIRQKAYYDNPRFHASIAWALLSHPSRLEGEESQSDGAAKGAEQFQTIDRLPEGLLENLSEKYLPKLVSSQIGTLEVTEIKVKIGKEVTSFRLKG